MASMAGFLVPATDEFLRKYIKLWVERKENKMFELATKKKSKLRLALMGVSGSGKTYTALRIATGIGGKIAVIDTEEGSASKYSDRFKFFETSIENAGIDKLISIIEYVNKSDFEVLIIDSLSHAWQELLDEVDKLTRTKYQGNSFRAWAEGTPKQKKLIKAILQCKTHVIVTMRAKTEHVQEKDDRGKTSIKKVGTGVEQGKGIEYEFDLLIDLSQDHIAHVTKDRTGKFQDALIDKPDEKLGKELKAWLDEGIEIVPDRPVLGNPNPEKEPWEIEPTLSFGQKNEFLKIAATKKMTVPTHVDNWCNKYFGEELKNIPSSKFNELMQKIQEKEIIEEIV